MPTTSSSRPGRRSGRRPPGWRPACRSNQASGSQRRKPLDCACAAYPGAGHGVPKTSTSSVLRCGRDARGLQTSAPARGALSVGPNTERRMYERSTGRRGCTLTMDLIRRITLMEEFVVPDIANRLFGADQS